LFDSEANWLQRSTTFGGSTSNNERWSQYSTYIRTDGDNFTIKFDGCDMTFSGSYGVDTITRSGDSC
jgi:hypothetical protein